MTDDCFIQEATRTLVPSFRRLGFAVTRSCSRSIEMASPYYKLRLFQGLKSNAIGLELYDGGDIINLQHLFALSKTPVRSLTASSRIAVQRHLRWLDSFLFPRFERLLSGDTLERSTVFQQAKAHDAHFTYELTLSPRIQEANGAFREKRYGDVINILGPIEAQLTPLQHRKLRFAREAVHRSGATQRSIREKS